MRQVGWSNCALVLVLAASGPSARAGLEPGPGGGADLDVTFIERTPRYDFDAAKNRPAPGDTVTFHGHIKAWGTDKIATASYAWKLDGQVIHAGTLTNLAPGDEQVVTWSWTWQDGPHRIALVADPDGLIGERSELNNMIEDRTDGIIVGFWVERSLYDYFAQYQPELPGVGSSSWEDWAQRQMRFWNQFNAQAIYPTTPKGVEDRVRIDKIVVVPDGALPLAGGLPTNHPDFRDRTVDLMWGFPASALNGTMYANHTRVAMDNPFYYEGSLLHELGHARYLIDTYGFDVHNTSSHHSVQIYEGGTYVAGSNFMPFIAFGEVLHYNKYGKMMSGGYDQGWSEYDAACLQRIAGRRARCGNYNAPCNIGEFLTELPERNHIRLVDANGKPRARASVRVYQAAGGPGWYGKTIDNTPDLAFNADGAGTVHVGRNPFSGGPVWHSYGNANGICVLRIEHQGQVWYRFQEITDFNIQYWRGNTQDAYYTITLAGPNYAPADFNRDGDVDPEDFAHFRECRTGPGGGPPSAGCGDADIDLDGDVDQDDFGFFQRCLSGPRIPADPGCAG